MPCLGCMNLSNACSSCRPKLEALLGITPQVGSLEPLSELKLDRLSVSGNYAPMEPRKQELLRDAWNAHVIISCGGWTEFAKMHTQISGEEYKRAFEAGWLAGEARTR